MYAKISRAEYNLLLGDKQSYRHLIEVLDEPFKGKEDTISVNLKGKVRKEYFTFKDSLASLKRGMKAKDKTQERSLIDDLINMKVEEYVDFVQNIEEDIKPMILGVLRATFVQNELAFRDLGKKINDKDSYTKEEAELYTNLALVNKCIEDKCTLLETSRKK